MKRALLVACGAVVVACHHHASLGPAVDRSNGALPMLAVHHVGANVIKIDGHAEEAAWKSAASTGLFVNPGNGKAAPRSHVNAVGRMLWDDAHLYVTVTVQDDNPTTPFSRGDVDPHIWERASGVELMLQPGDHPDNKNYYELQIDPAGAVWDTHFDDYNKPVGGGRFGHQEWKSGLQRQASVDKSAGTWTVELALPWSSVTGPRDTAPPRQDQTWKANLYSFRDGQRDSLSWSPILGQGNFHRASRFGRITFTR